MLSIIKQRKIWFIISAAMVSVSLIAFVLIGLNLGIDFTGGSLLEVEFLVTRPTSQQINEALVPLEIGNIVSQPLGENAMTLRFKNVDEETHQRILATLNEKFQPTNKAETETDELFPINEEGGEASSINENDEGESTSTPTSTPASAEAMAGEEAAAGNEEIKILEEKRFDSIGPIIGQELKKKTIWAIVIILIAIISYIAWAFRKVSKPVASWKYGLIAIIALAHDVIITIGVFVILGKIYGTEVNAPFVAALLTILGYSVNDTIVIFDRIRENLIRRLGEEFDEIIQDSINEVIIRSINTAFTTLLALFALLVFGGATLRDFVLALIIGIAIGTYSSIFLASPLLVTWEKIRAKR